LLDGSKLEYLARLTGGPGDATEITREALGDGCRRVVCVGGDGTLNEVVNGFFDDEGNAVRGDAALGIIPAGTGGDFRRSLDQTVDTQEAVRRLSAATTRRIDVGRIDFGDGTHRFFINIADCGLGGEVAARVNRSRRKGGGVRGTALFLWSSLATLMTYRGCDLTVEIDGVSVRRRLRNLVIANGKYFGGGMKVAPAAALDDGRFDVVLVGMTSRFAALRGIPSLYKGTHVNRKEVEVVRGSRVNVSAADSQTVLFDLEGEQIGQVPARITCLASALSVIA
jgi:YegS/Rv2252/BmrU family lipid kinase